MKILSEMSRRILQFGSFFAANEEFNREMTFLMSLLMVLWELPNLRLI